MVEILKAEGLVKRFGGIAAVNGVSFAVRRGEIFGFLGPNGAGKTTTINLLTGLARPDSGFIFLEGREYTDRPGWAQREIGVVPDESNLYDELDGFENLTFCASLYGMGKKRREARAEELLHLFGLAQVGRRPFKTYSKGMKRRLTLAAGMVHEPKILFLDEPTTGIDVMSARQIRALIGQLNRRGATVFLTTHYIEEAQRLCHRIAFIVEGKVVRIGSLAELMQEHQRGTVLLLTVEEARPQMPALLAGRFPGCAVESLEGRSLRVSSDGAIELLPLLSALSSLGATVTEARLLQPTLEEVFVRLTGIEAERMRQEREGGGR